MDEKKRNYRTCGYLTEADLTEEEKQKIWDFIYANSSRKKGKHDMKFTKEEYAHCMKHEGAINDMLETIEDHGGKLPDGPNPTFIWTLITYAE